MKVHLPKFVLFEGVWHFQEKIRMGGCCCLPFERREEKVSNEGWR